jgi:hypothetical protein
MDHNGRTTSVFVLRVLVFVNVAGSADAGAWRRQQAERGPARRACAAP